MSTFLKLTAIAGAKNEQPLCYLLEVDSVHILLDCGWFDTFDPHDPYLKHLRRLAKQVDLVLLSHPDLPHLGAYPFAFAHLGLTCPAYATLPVHHMGKIAMLDALKSKTESEPFDCFTKENIDAAFDRMIQLKYSQPTGLIGKCKGITITAYSAGHTIGGTIWKIRKDTDEIIYAVDYNHKKDRHLNGTALHSGGAVLEALARPSLLITDAYNATSVHPARKNRDAALFDTLITTLRNEGSCLLPVDAASRVLELAHMLDQHWQYHRLNQYPLVLLTHYSYRTAQYAKSMLEWMGDAVAKHFASTRESPYQFKYVRLCHSIADLAQLPAGPKVVMATSLSMETGFSRELFAEWAKDSKNSVVLTGRGSANSLADILMRQWKEKATEALDTKESVGKPAGVVLPATKLDYHMNLELKQRVPLEGSELVEYNNAQRARQEREATQALLIERSKQIVEESDSDESDVSDVDEGEIEGARPSTASSLNPSASVGNSSFRSAPLFTSSSSSLWATAGHDLYVKDATRSGGFFKQTQSYRMFPYLERKRRFDDYGETIVPEHYIRAGEVEVPDVDKQVETKSPETGVEDMEIDLIAKEEPEPETPSVPTKYVTVKHEVHVACTVQYVDLEGLSDGKSVKTILPQVAPRKLIIVHGSEDATTQLVNYCKSNKQMTDEIYAPAVGETINVSSATNIHQVKLTDSLVSSLAFKKMDEYELAHLTTHVQIPADSIVPVLDILPPNKAEEAWHRPVFVGEVRLTDLKRALQAEGVSAEFGGEGVLFCNDSVAIRKTPSGKVQIEGAISDDYYKCRSVLYSMHAIL